MSRLWSTTGLGSVLPECIRKSQEATALKEESLDMLAGSGRSLMPVSQHGKAETYCQQSQVRLGYRVRPCQKKKLPLPLKAQNFSENGWKNTKSHRSKLKGRAIRQDGGGDHERQVSSRGPLHSPTQSSCANRL